MRKADWLIGVLIALLVLLGISYFVRTYKTIQNQNPDRPSVEETLNQKGANETATLDEEDEYDEEEYPEDEDTITDEPTIDDLADLNAAKEQAAADAAAAEDAAIKQPQSYSSNADAGGKFLVVAGTFKQEANAQIQLKKFKSMGYTDAEIGKFNKSAYASLIVDRFGSSAEAQKLARTLKNKGIDCYVHKKR